MLKEIKVYIEGVTLLRYQDENDNLYFDEFGERKDENLTREFKYEKLIDNVVDYIY